MAQDVNDLQGLLRGKFAGEARLLETHKNEGYHTLRAVPLDA